MNPRQLLLLGCCLYAAALAATAPATWLNSALHTASDGRWQLSSATGTVWQGTGQLEMHSNGRQIALASRYSWALQPAALWQAALLFRIKNRNDIHAEKKPPFSVRIDWRGIEISQADIRLYASTLSDNLPSLSHTGLTGQLQIQAPQLLIRYADNVMQGKATLRWYNAGSILSPVSPLGDYELQLQADEQRKGIHAQLITLQGSLQLHGEGWWQHGQRPSFDGIASIAPALQAELSPFLRLIAPETGQGTFAIHMQ